MKVQRSPAPQATPKTTPDLGPSPQAVQLKRTLAGQSLDAQEAALAPPSQAVQMKADPVQRKGWEPNYAAAAAAQAPTSSKANAPGAQGWDLSQLNPEAAAAQRGAGGGAPAAAAQRGAGGAAAAPSRPAPTLQPADIVQQAFTLGGQSRYQVSPQEAMAWIERNMGFAPPDQRFAWQQARLMVNKRL